MTRHLLINNLGSFTAVKLSNSFQKKRNIETLNDNYSSKINKIYYKQLMTEAFDVF